MKTNKSMNNVMVRKLRNILSPQYALLAKRTFECARGRIQICLKNIASEISKMVGCWLIHCVEFAIVLLPPRRSHRFTHLQALFSCSVQKSNLGCQQGKLKHIGNIIRCNFVSFHAMTILSGTISFSILHTFLHVTCSIWTLSPPAVSCKKKHP